jgi:hypothetical protein
MSKSITIFVAGAIIAFAAFTVSGQAPAQPRQGFMSALKQGQAVSLKEVAGRFEISTLDDTPGPLGFKITEVGPDYLIVVDIADVTETRIPVYSIKSIVRLKVPKN